MPTVAVAADARSTACDQVGRTSPIEGPTCAAQRRRRPSGRLRTWHLSQAMIAGSGTVIAGSGTVIAGSGTVIAGSGTVIAGSGTLIAGSGTLIAGSGTLIAGSGTVIADSGKGGHRRA